ncbi:DEAD/DEAH box helicase [Paenibacillus sp. 2KB_22]|uniref:DEAD/DEAH box helicase n=1 Tax=Paenibacillus sp. 2KB_22 TaxID=3232978 RepID=UPI003F9A80EA
MKGLTLTRLRNTNFKDLYEKLLVGKIDKQSDYQKLLSLAVIFINEKNTDISRLGYRIIVFYCNLTKDYKPLYDIALNEGLIPIVKLIENSEKYKAYLSDSFFNSFFSSYGENYKNESVYFSEQQKELLSFFNENINQTVSVIAPTSYGKSELIISTLKSMERGNVCIVVPTKALLFQTRQRLIKSEIKNLWKVITHPEMYNAGEENVTAVLTQERLLRLLRKNPALSFDMVFIDEAHNLLEDNDRSVLLAATISILEKRNSDVIFKFLTPFLIDETNLKVKYSNYSPESFRITEYIKTEKFYIYDFRLGSVLKIYDHYIDNFFTLETTKKFMDDIEFILENKTRKNLIYLNKPTDIEKVAARLLSRIEDIKSDQIRKACKELSDYLHSDYFLIDCIKKGFIYHHGSVPDNVRNYIEHIFSAEATMNFVITSSTLLEGVNLPVERLFMLDNKKGRGNLKPAQFKNLIGRICRFSEIFDRNSGRLEKLEPKIFLVVSEYFSSNANINDFIKNSMKVDKKIKDEVTNVLLENVNITQNNSIQKEEADEFLENFEPGIISNYNKGHAETEVGKLCFMNNTTEIDILTNENLMQDIADGIPLKSVDNVEDIFNIFADLFLPFIKAEEKYNNLNRLEYKESRRFYQMFLNWRIRNASYKEMITSFLRYWSKVEESNDSDVFVGKWGDKQREGFRELWTDIRYKNRVQRVNLAIVRIKEEQDFLDNTFIKYIEVINDLGILVDEFYEKIKYGTTNKNMITLIKNGLSSGLSSLLVSNYSDEVEIDSNSNTILLKPSLIDRMTGNSENDILIHEVRYNSRLNNSN